MRVIKSRSESLAGLTSTPQSRELRLDAPLMSQTLVLLKVFRCFLSSFRDGCARRMTSHHECLEAC